jgi:hypothetical protein
MKLPSQIRLTFIAVLTFFSLAADAPDYTGRPYNKDPIAIPGTIKATEYDIAPSNANGITFNYSKPPKPGKIRTTGDCIGLGTFDKSHVTTKGEPEDLKQTYLGWTEAGEWTKYTLQVKTAGTYVIGGHFAAGLKGAKVSFAFGDVTTGPLEIPTTAGFQPGVEVYHVWERLDNLAEVKLPAGDVVMKFKIEAVAGINVESITLTLKNDSATR